MSEFIYYFRRFIRSLDATDGGDLIRATAHPTKLQFGAFDTPCPACTPSPDKNNPKIAIVLWGQTCDGRDRELRVTNILKKRLMELADRGPNGGTMVVCGVAWRMTCHVGDLESSDGVSSTMSSLV